MSRMDHEGIRFEEVLALAKQLSPADKLRLLQQVLPDLKAALRPEGPPKTRSLRGILKGYHFPDEVIAQARQAMWGRLEEPGS